MPELPAPDKLNSHWLLTALKADGRIDAAQQARAATRIAGSREHPLIAVGQCELEDQGEDGGLLDAERLTEWLAERTDTRYQRIDPLQIDPAATAQAVAYAYARKAGILVLRRGHETATIACGDPFDMRWKAELAPVLKSEIQTVLANPADIDRYLLEFHSLHRASKKTHKRRGGTQVLENLMRLGRRDNLSEDDQHVIGVVDWLLQYAFENRASDIHLEPRRGIGRIRLRIDGALHDIYQLPDNVFAAVTSRLKILAGCNLVERRRPQDGRIKTVSPEGREVELRLATLPTAFGEKLVLRIFDPGLVVQGMQELGMQPEQLSAWTRLCEAPHGLVLVTGPTGSGKTTTLYSTLRALSSPRRNICTVEDPIELIEPRINQTQVNASAGLGFAEGLRALLRQDPDIIMVGEIRDRDTAATALQAALTGHLVLVTLHTNTAVGAIVRLLELDVPAYLLRATLLGVLAQRLVRKLCPNCKTPEPEATLAARWTALGVAAAQPDSAFAAVGCLECRETGYRGRMGLYEVLVADSKMRQQIRDHTEISELEEAARKAGLKSLRDAGAQAVAAGETSLDEVFHNLLFH